MTPKLRVGATRLISGRIFPTGVTLAFCLSGAGVTLEEYESFEAKGGCVASGGGRGLGVGTTVAREGCFSTGAGMTGAGETELLGTEASLFALAAFFLVLLISVRLEGGFNVLGL